MSDVSPPPTSAAPTPGTMPPTAVPPVAPPVNVQPISYPAAERAAVTPWNGLSIASLVLSIIGLSLLGVILGHISLSQIKRTGEQGYVLALIGVILGYLGIVVWVGLAIFTVLMLAAGVLVWNVAGLT